MFRGAVFSGHGIYLNFSDVVIVKKINDSDSITQLLTIGYSMLVKFGQHCTVKLQENYFLGFPLSYCTSML